MTVKINYVKYWLETLWLSKDNFEKDLISLKYSIINKDLIKLKDINGGVFFNETASIYYLNSNLDNISKTEFDDNSDNFFSKAVSLYLDDN